jgi:hypothetical protein
MTEEDKKLNELDKAIESLGLGDDVAERGNRVPIKPVTVRVERPPLFQGHVTKELTLVEQMNRAEEIQASLRNKLRREKLDLLQEHDRGWTEIKQTYANLIHDAVTKLEAERDKALRDLADTYHTKTREYDLLLERMG